MEGIIADLRRAIDVKVREEEQALGAGKAADWPDYQRRCGLILGLKRAKDTLNDVVKRYINEDEVLDEFDEYSARDR